MENINNENKIGYIYKITSPNTNNVYIGSTFNDIKNRFKQHLIKPTSRSQLIILAGEPKVELIEELECQNRIQLNKREGHHIINNINCINKCIAGRSLQDSQKAYKLKHKEWYREYIKEWRRNNPDKVKAYYKRGPN
jgi:hypothetical protein